MFPIICAECDSQFFADSPNDAPLCPDCIANEVVCEDFDDDYGSWEDREDRDFNHDGQPSEYTEWMDYDPDC